MGWEAEGTARVAAAKEVEEGLALAMGVVVMEGEEVRLEGDVEEALGVDCLAAEAKSFAAAPRFGTSHRLQTARQRTDTDSSSRLAPIGRIVRTIRMVWPRSSCFQSRYQSGRRSNPDKCHWHNWSAGLARRSMNLEIHMSDQTRIPQRPTSGST